VLGARLTTHGRRVPGTGSVRRTKSGKWAATGPEHRRHRVHLGLFESLREAEAALEAHLREVES